MTVTSAPYDPRNPEAGYVYCPPGSACLVCGSAGYPLRCVPTMGLTNPRWFACIDAEACRARAGDVRPL